MFYTHTHNILSSHKAIAGGSYFQTYPFLDAGLLVETCSIGCPGDRASDVVSCDFVFSFSDRYGRHKRRRSFRSADSERRFIPQEHPFRRKLTEIFLENVW